MPRNRYLFGEIAIEKGYVTLDQVAQAITEQSARNHSHPVGTLLVELGHLSDEQRMEVLHDQIRRIAADGDKLFGQVAVERGFVTRHALEEAVRSQARMEAQGRHRLLGELLIESGCLLPHQAEFILEFQRLRREFV